MADKPNNLLLDYMPRFDRRLTEFDTKLDRVLGDMHDTKVAMTAVEEILPGVQRPIDRLEVRIERIERRLDLVGTPQ
jgi:hypothetical protein